MTSNNDSPNEFTVLLKVLDIVELSLRNAGRQDLNGHERTQLIAIVNKISASQVTGPLFGNIAEVKGDVMGDSYIVGQAGAVGPNSTASNISFQQIWQQVSNGTDLARLAEELEKLRSEMRGQASTPEEDIVLAEVGRAHLAARDGDGPRVLAHLRQAGQWALDIAKQVGTSVAEATIKSAMGL